MTLRSDDQSTHLKCIWDALHGYREPCIPPDISSGYDEEWDDICTAMAWITEDLQQQERANDI